MMVAIAGAAVAFTAFLAPRDAERAAATRHCPPWATLECDRR